MTTTIAETMSAMATAATMATTRLEKFLVRLQGFPSPWPLRPSGGSDTRQDHETMRTRAAAENLRPIFDSCPYLFVVLRGRCVGSPSGGSDTGQARVARRPAAVGSPSSNRSSTATIIIDKKS